MSDSGDLESLYYKTWMMIDELSKEFDPLAIAGVISTQALTIYKTVLSPEEFEMMVDTISNSRDKIQIIENPVLQ